MDINSNHFSIFVEPIVSISLLVPEPSLLIYWGFLAAPLFTASMFSGEHRDEGRRRFLSNTEPLLLNLL
jgi:hypothetical protein